jgi:lipopolysaccharide transport system permease protein
MWIELRRSLGFAGPEQALDAQAKDVWEIDAAAMGSWDRLKEFWHYRRIAGFFSKKFVVSLYQGMRLGIFWLFARPLLPIAISAFIFGGLLGVPSEGLPYFLFFLAGSVTWLMFERSLLFVTRSLDSSKSLIKRVYFPRLIIPFCAVSPGVVYFLIYIGLFFGALIYYLVAEGTWYLVLGPRLLWAGVAVALALWLAISVGLWTAVWMTYFREIRLTIRYVSRFWFYLTPVIYPISEVPEQYHWAIYVNPMAPIVETFKWATLGVGDFYPLALLTSTLIIGVVFAGGVWYFGRSEAVAIDKL